MSVKLRFVRVGKKNHSAFRLCAIDSRKARDGQYLENLGFYDPYQQDDQKKFRLKRDRAEYWLRVGAQPSQTVLDFFKREKVAGLIPKPKRKRRRKAVARAADAVARAGSAGAAARPARPARKPKPPKKPKPQADKSSPGAGAPPS